MYHNSLQPWFKPFQGVKLTKREQYQECFTPYYHATYRPSHQTPTSHLRTLQPDGDDHRPVTATSQKRIGIGFQLPRLTAQALLTIDTILMLSYSSMWSARSPGNERIVDSIGIPYLFTYKPINFCTKLHWKLVKSQQDRGSACHRIFSQKNFFLTLQELQLNVYIQP